MTGNRKPPMTIREVRHDDQYLYKRVSDDTTVAGVTASGHILTREGATDNLTNEEWADLMQLTSKRQRKLAESEDL